MVDWSPCVCYTAKISGGVALNENSQNQMLTLAVGSRVVSFTLYPISRSTNEYPVDITIRTYILGGNE
jgi:hypothetical protein